MKLTEPGLGVLVEGSWFSSWPDPILHCTSRRLMGVEQKKREGFAEEVATERRFEGGLKGVKRVVEMGVI